MSNTKTENRALTFFFGIPTIVSCDRNCNKAWGRNSRPRYTRNIHGKMIEDKYLARAPINPMTYEGGIGKPISPDEFPTKWCVRECERCVIEITQRSKMKQDFVQNNIDNK